MGQATQRMRRSPGKIAFKSSHKSQDAKTEEGSAASSQFSLLGRGTSTIVQRLLDTSMPTRMVDWQIMRRRFYLPLAPLGKGKSSSKVIFDGICFGLSPLPVTVANEGLVRDPLVPNGS